MLSVSLSPNPPSSSLPSMRSLLPLPNPSRLFLFFSILLAFLFFYHYSTNPIPIKQSLRSSSSSSSSHFLSFSASANISISSDLLSLTKSPGTPSSSVTTSFILSRLHSFGFKTFVKNYFPLLSFRSHSSLSLHNSNGSFVSVISLSEPADPEGILQPAYHAYSPSGDVFAPAVYANFGCLKDFERLEELGVEVRGSVVVVRKGGGYRGGVVKRASEFGAKAVLIAGGLDGGVERGTVILNGPGDPPTPGWGASENGGFRVERLEMEAEEVKRRFQTIPSMPISADSAMEILRSLGGLEMPKEWRDGLVKNGGGVGPGPKLVNFTYKEERKITPIQNLFAIIKGHSEPDRYIILGNHRDSWTYGAVDPHSGTSAFLDVIRRFGKMVESGWRPRRTIVLCSWDAEEFGMMGSTEWVEENLGNLKSKAVAYLNVDCAVQGEGFNVGVSPQLDQLLIDVTKQVKDPDVEGRTVYDAWVAANAGIRIERLARADSDFSAFTHHAGIPSLDMYYGDEFSGYHTALDSYEWMEKQGDPFFHRHLAIAEIWGLLALRLADDLIVPFDYISYASQLEEHVNALNSFVDENLSLEPIREAISEFRTAANEISEEREKLRMRENTIEDVLKGRELNDRLMLVERSFLKEEGLKGRPWFKHLLYSPAADYESKISFFTGIVDALYKSKKMGRRGQSIVRHEIWVVARAIEKATKVLRGDLP